MAMTTDGDNVRECASFEEIRAAVHEVELIMQRHGIEIRPGSELESISLFLQELPDFRSGKTPIDPSRNVRDDWRKGLGLFDMIVRIVRCDRKGKLEPFLKYLELLNSSAVPQNVPGRFDQGGSKLFELLIGLACLSFGSNISMDDPFESIGDNPDILLETGGRSWGIACKVMNSPSPLTFYERLADGIDQIERSPADTGVVVFNVKNLIDHDKTWPLETSPLVRELVTGSPIARTGIEPVAVMLQKTADSIVNGLREENSLEKVCSLFEGKRTIPAFAQVLQTATGVWRRGHRVPTLITILARAPLAQLDSESDRVAECLNTSLQCFGGLVE